MKAMTRYGSTARLTVAVAAVVFGSSVDVGFAAADVEFERYVIDLDVEQPTVLIGDFVGEPTRDLAIVSREGVGVLRLQIYALEGGAWVERRSARLSSDTRYVDVAGMGERDRLLTYAPGRLRWFDPESDTERALVDLPDDLAVPNFDRLPHVDVTHDLNGDGLDDLLVPGADGFHVFVQRPAADFASPLPIGKPFDAEWMFDGSGYRFDPWATSRIHAFDHDHDGRVDLVFWSEDRFLVHRQTDHAEFDHATTSFTTQISFDDDDVTSLVAPHGIHRRRKDHNPSGRMEGRVLHSIRDHDADGVADLVVFEVGGGGRLLGMESRYQVHAGREVEGRTVFVPEVTSEFRAKGILSRLDVLAFGSGEHPLVAVEVFRVGLVKAAAALISSVVRGSVSADLHLFTMKDGAFPEAPAVRRRIRSFPGDSGERTAHPFAETGDVTGDGLPDLIVQEGSKELRIFPGVADATLFEERPQRLAVDMPRSEFIRLDDLTGDGRPSLVLHQGVGTGTERVMTLIPSR